MNGAAFYLFTMGDWGNAFLWIMNNYFPMGSFWILLGLGIYFTVYNKFESQQIAFFCIALYGIAVAPWIQIGGASILPEISKYVYYAIAIVIAIGLYYLFMRNSG